MFILPVGAPGSLSYSRITDATSYLRSSILIHNLSPDIYRFHHFTLFLRNYSSFHHGPALYVILNQELFLCKSFVSREADFFLFTRYHFDLYVAPWFRIGVVASPMLHPEATGWENFIANTASVFCVTIFV